MAQILIESEALDSIKRMVEELEKEKNERIQELESALRDCVSDLKWIEKQDIRNNFKASILKAWHVLSKG